MATDVWEDKQIVKQAEEILKSHYPEMVNFNFKFLFREKASYRAKPTKANATIRALTDADAIITINAEEWNALDSVQRKALIHWSLAHFETQEKKDGSIKLKKRKPEIQDFPEVVAEYGAWQPEITDYVQACRDRGKEIREEAQKVNLRKQQQEG